MVVFHVSTFILQLHLLELLDAFWEERGGFDIVHFHNLEGLSLPVLRLKERHPDAKFCLSLHNYFLFCPQVNLWTSAGENCYRSSCFPSCSHCVPAANTKVERWIASAKSLLPDASVFCITKLYRILKKGAASLRRASAHKDQAAQNPMVLKGEADCVYSEYRRRNVQDANRYLDLILAVSRQTAEIAQKYGIREDKICIDYIGTLAASNRIPPQKPTNAFLQIGFLGYARKDKGFDFLLEALSLISPQAASKMSIVLAAKCDTAEQYEAYSQQLKTHLQYFRSYRFVNGYTKSDQRALLREIDIGVVPALWEDNLPQVAIEYIANGVPILVSDAGGAKELCTNPDFVYSCADASELCQKLEAFALCPCRVSEFWNDPPLLTSMEDHVRNLKQFYCQ